MCTAQSGAGDLGPGQLGSYDHVLIQAPARLQAVTNPAWNGHCAIRVEVQPGDGDDTTSDRDEMTGTGTLWPSGTP